MASDNLIAVLNEHLQFSGLQFIENIHLNEKFSTDNGHFVDQGTYTEGFFGGTISGSFLETSNQNHFLFHSDYTFTSGGNTYEYRSDTEENDNRYQTVSHEFINGQPQAVFHDQFTL